MSVMTEITYNILNTVSNECKEHENCTDCPFYYDGEISHNWCMFAVAPYRWDMKMKNDMVNVIHKKYNK